MPCLMEIARISWVPMSPQTVETPGWMGANVAGPDHVGSKPSITMFDLGE